MVRNTAKAKAEHEHQDPRGPAHKADPWLAAAHVDPRLVNQGALKARGVPRRDTMVNWARKAPHPKEW